MSYYIIYNFLSESIPMFLLYLTYLLKRMGLVRNALRESPFSWFHAGFPCNQSQACGIAVVVSVFVVIIAALSLFLSLFGQI